MRRSELSQSQRPPRELIPVYERDTAAFRRHIARSQKAHDLRRNAAMRRVRIERALISEQHRLAYRPDVRIERSLQRNLGAYPRGVTDCDRNARQRRRGLSAVPGCVRDRVLGVE